MIPCCRYMQLALMALALIFIQQCDFESKYGNPYSLDSWETFDKSTGLISNRIRSIKTDSQGNLWVGTFDNGLMKFDGQGWQFFNIYDGLPSYSVSSVEEDPNGNIWIGTWKGVSIYNGQSFTENIFLVDDMIVLDILRDSKDIMWIATYGYGLIKMEDFSNSTQFYMEEEPGSFYVHSVDEDSNGTIWAGTEITRKSPASAATFSPCGFPMTRLPPSADEKPITCRASCRRNCTAS